MSLSRVIGFVLVCLVLLTALGSTQSAPTAPSLDDLGWRHIGPTAFGGRIDDIEAVPDQPWIIFVGAASGGVFKSTNNGVTWRPVLDRDATMLSVGDIAIAPSDPNVVWVGMGEPNNRQSSSWGDGIYRSLDGGETWTHMGLAATHHIGRVAIHPRDPNTVFVAALGHLWGPNPERGLFRTTDAGTTWQKVLGIDNDTGVVDVAIDRDGRTLYAATYQRRRRAWGFVGGGPGSGLYRSLDGGTTWTKLTNGLPAGDVGRIGIAIAASQPDTVYATYEHREGGVFRSDDRGASWTKQSSTNQRPSYYSQIRVDPKNPNRVWMLASPLFVSIDGGKTFRSDWTGDRIHVDHHALWIDPEHPDHMMLGNDGGLYFTYDGARSWDFVDNLPIGQYYDIGVDSREPYWIYGGTQDNGTWGLPSRTAGLLGITNLDVVNIAYGDGFFTQPDPKNPRVIYANSQSGRAYVVDLETKEERGVRPVPEDPKQPYRFNWSTPLLVSPHDGSIVYYGGNKLFQTTDRGQRWREISPDLSKNDDWKKRPIMGIRDEKTLSRDDGVSDFGTITTISESPAQAGLIYVGTDDGQVQMTRDQGKQWANITSKFALPGERWVSRVLASRHAAATAYVSFDGHQDDDFRPYIFKTTDTGATWRSVAGNLPNGVVVNSLAEHHRNPQLLFAGTESGLYYTLDGGVSWTLIRGNLPRVPIDDIVITERENDLVLGTHGRSIIILDDLGALEQSTPRVLSEDLHLFPIRPATQEYQARRLPQPGAAKFSGPNPPPGALITYHVKSAAGTDVKVKITIADASGSVVREFDGPGATGLHRVAWDLRHALSATPADSDEGWFGPPAGPFVVPGTYTVRLSAGSTSATETVEVRADRRMTPTAQTLTARRDLSMALNALLGTFDQASQALQVIDKDLQRYRDALKERAAAGGATAAAERSKPATDAIEAFTKRLDAAKDKFKAGFNSPKFQILDTLGQLQASSSPPTEAQERVHGHVKASLTEGVALVNELVSKEWPALQQKLSSTGLTLAPAVIAPPK
ncbi:MAG: hypothetical protein U0Q12_20485 [Vicinamibacterales bacterium]